MSKYELKTYSQMSSAQKKSVDPQRNFYNTNTDAVASRVGKKAGKPNAITNPQSTMAAPMGKAKANQYGKPKA